jgi:hypothetical protein
VSYLPLPESVTVAAADQTGKNAGNLTNAFTVDKLPRGPSWFEAYHGVVTTVPAGAQAQIMIGSKLYGFTFPFGGSEWDPQQPMLLSAGQEVYFLWNTPASGLVLPVLTLWFRYDPALPGNPPGQVR